MNDAFAGTFHEYVLGLQTSICEMFESFEKSSRFEAKQWQRPAGHRLQGGGAMRVMRGETFEKVGVNVSHVWGSFSPQLAAQIPGAAESEGRFVACGISLVAHPFNPYVPTVHMNLRYLCTSRGWFGGGTDLTPTFPFDEDTAAFHEALRGTCENYRPGAHREFKEWCDRYFYLPHRQEPRGVGGIFFDELASGDLQRDFEFVRAVGTTFTETYREIVARRLATPFDDAARERLLVKRGRYVEFNLVYDRGTRFGFGTDADPEAYLMSLPPLAKW
jgi:coproporphyrinogen III oxidase